MCECFQLQLGCVSSTDLSHLVEYGRHLATPIVYRRSGVCRDKWTPGANSLIDAPHLPAYSCLSMHIFQLDAHLHKIIHCMPVVTASAPPPHPPPTPHPLISARYWIVTKLVLSRQSLRYINLWILPSTRRQTRSSTKAKVSLFSCAWQCDI